MTAEPGEINRSPLVERDTTASRQRVWEVLADELAAAFGRWPWRFPATGNPRGG